MKKKMMQALVIAVSAAFAVCGFTGCTGGSGSKAESKTESGTESKAESKTESRAESKTEASSLIGSWDSVEAPGTVYTFNEDGTAILDMQGIEMRFTYTDKDGDLTLKSEASGAEEKFTYTISGNILSLHDLGLDNTLAYKKMNGKDPTESTSSEETDVERNYSIVGTGMLLGKYSLSLQEVREGDGDLHTISVDVPSQEFVDAARKCDRYFYIVTAAKNGDMLDQYRIVDQETGEDYGQLDAEGILEKYDPLYGREKVEWTYDGDEVLLSTLETGKVYMAGIQGEIFFTNDTGKNYLLYCDGDYMTSKWFVMPGSALPEMQLESCSVSPALDDGSIRFGILGLDLSELKGEAADEVAFVNGLSAGEDVDVWFKSVVANAGDTDVAISYGYSNFETEESVEYETVIPAGGVYGLGEADFVMVK